MDRKGAGIALLVVAILFFVGAIFQATILRENKQTHEDQKGDPGYDGSDEEKHNEELIDAQTNNVAMCGGLFLIFLIVGVILMAMGRPEQSQQTVVYQQAPVPQYQTQPQYQQPPQMAQCHRCGNGIQPGWNLCPNCGAQQDSWD